MNLLPQCFLYTQDETLVTRISGSLKSTSRVCHITDPHDLEIQLLKYEPVLLFFDLRAESTKILLPRIFKEMPDSLVMAFGLQLEINQSPLSSLSIPSKLLSPVLATISVI